MNFEHIINSDLETYMMLNCSNLTYTMICSKSHIWEIAYNFRKINLFIVQSQMKFITISENILHFSQKKLSNLI